jgi:hypothetical protein
MNEVEQVASAAAAIKAAASAASSTIHLPPQGLASVNASHWLAVIALMGVIGTVAIAAVVLMRLPDDVDLETRKIRFAAATFTGILILFVFAAIMYLADVGDRNAGKEIFEKAITAMTPLAGVIVGYLFGTRSLSHPKSVARDEGDKSPTSSNAT